MMSSKRSNALAKIPQSLQNASRISQANQKNGSKSGGWIDSLGSCGANSREEE